MSETKTCPTCRELMDPDRAWWWNGYGAACTERCIRDLIRDHEGGIQRSEPKP